MADPGPAAKSLDVNAQGGTEHWAPLPMKLVSKRHTITNPQKVKNVFAGKSANTGQNVAGKRLYVPSPLSCEAAVSYYFTAKFWLSYILVALTKIFLYIFLYLPLLSFDLNRSFLAAEIFGQLILLLATLHTCPWFNFVWFLHHYLENSLQCKLCFLHVVIVTQLFFAAITKIILCFQYFV